MPGPRKNLTPLDMQMMGLAFNQGGIINFLGKQPEVTAPIKAQSHADSPPVQLAYITDAEKDLLVNANIHGSMAGKPNPGPAGLPSLDDFFNIPGGGIGGGSTSNTGGSVGGGGNQGGGSSAEDYGIGAGQAVGGSDSGTVFVPTGGPPGQQQGFTQADAAAQEAALLQSQIAQEKAAVEAAKKAAELITPKESKKGLKLDLTFGKPIKDLSPSELNKILDEVKRYKDGLPNYFEGFPGGFNIAKGMFDSITQGEEREDGSPTLQGLEKYIRTLDEDSNILDSFKEADPATYLDTFGLPQTNAGLDFFANLSLDDDTVDKKTQQKIIEARERLAQSKESQDRASGIMSTPAFAIAPGQDAPPKPGPGFTPDAPTGPSFTPQNTSPFDLSQFYAGLPSYSYGQQGVMSPNINPDLASYFENLKKYYGVG